MSIKEILDERIAGMNKLIASSEKNILAEQLFRNQIAIRKAAFEEILGEVEELESTCKPESICALCGGKEDYAGQHVHVIPPAIQSSDGNDGRVQPGQKSQAEINPVPQSSDSSASDDNSKNIIDSSLPEVQTIERGEITPIPVTQFKEEIKNTIKTMDSKPEKHVSLPSEIIPFKEVEAFTYNKLQLLKVVGKIKVYLSGAKVALYHGSYKLNIFTTVDEINRMKSLPEMDVKLTLQEYGKRTFENKAVVLRHFLRELKDANELKQEVKPKFKQVPAFTTLKQVDEAKT